MVSSSPLSGEVIACVSSLDDQNKQLCDQPMYATPWGYTLIWERCFSVFLGFPLTLLMAELGAREWTHGIALRGAEKNLRALDSEKD